MVQRKFTSSIKITSFDQKVSVSFIKKLMLLGGQKSYQCTFISKGSKVVNKKNTILRSPHIFKKARDQIEIQHISHFFRIRKKTPYSWLFFFSLFRQSNNFPIKLDYRHCYEQQLLYLLPTRLLPKGSLALGNKA
jgi:ribosomal protein S10